MRLLSVIKSFLKTGTIGFGGGSALIPVVEKEIVEDNKWIKEENFNITAVVANITPGALPVKLGCLWNSKYSVISAYCIALPGVLMIISLLSLFSLIGESAIKYIEYASIGISVFIILLLYLYILKVQKEGKHLKLSNRYFTIMVAAFFLTGGKEIRQIIGILLDTDYQEMPGPLFDISIIDLMIISFFIICFMGSSKSGVKLSIAGIISILYALAKGKMQILSRLSTPCLVLMICLTAISVFYDFRKAAKGNRKRTAINYKYLRNIAVFAGIAAAISGTALAIRGADAGNNGTSTGGYIINAIVSTVTSFGGGEAYVSVSEGFFVQTGYVEPQVFYNQILATANALPGPILVKIVSAIGFEYGYHIGGMGYGWILALAGTTVSIGLSAIGALVVMLFFDSMKDSPRLHMIKTYILPVICGMLISTVLSILYETLKVLTKSVAINPFSALGILVLLFFAMLFLHKKAHLSDIVILLLGGGGSLLVLSLI